MWIWVPAGSKSALRLVLLLEQTKRDESSLRLLALVRRMTPTGAEHAEESDFDQGSRLNPTGFELELQTTVVLLPAW
jgi:hypothetical protein